MIYELRVYDVVPGKMPELGERFSKVTLRFFDKYGIEVVGFWTDEVGASNRLTYILAFEDMKQRDTAWEGFRSDKERIALFAESERGGPLVARITNTIMRPTAYSPLK